MFDLFLLNPFVFLPLAFGFGIYNLYRNGNETDG